MCTSVSAVLLPMHAAERLHACCIMHITPTYTHIIRCWMHILCAAIEMYVCTQKQTNVHAGEYTQLILFVHLASRDRSLARHAHTQQCRTRSVS